MNRFPSLLLAAALASTLPAAAASHAVKKDSGGFAWENAIIHIEVTSKAYNYIQPWERSEKKVYKSGVVIEGHEIITTADGLADQTLIRLKKQGGGLFSLGHVDWIDYQANLAAIASDDAGFWKGLTPAKLAEPVPASGPVHVLRWRGDTLEDRKGDIERMTVENSALSFVSVPALKVDSNIPGVGYGEAVVADNKLVGLAYAQGGDAITAVPTSFIAPIVKAEQAKTYTGLGFFDFTWDTPENPLNLEYLKLAGPARGVILKETGMKPGVPSLVKPRDVLLSIDGFDIDAEGNYSDPDYKKLSLENLSSRGVFAGQSRKFKLLRDGKEMDVVYTLPKAEFSDELLQEQTFDQAPEYVLAGGLVFVPLSANYLRSWGPNWRQRAPFRLSFFEMDKVKPDRPQRVVLTQVLPNPANIGYERLRNIVLDEVNGVKIKQVGDILTALKTPVDGFDVFKFDAGQSVQQVVLDASQLDHVNQQIMARYHIPTDHVLNPAGAPVVDR
jgi:hypothetical protein